MAWLGFVLLAVVLIFGLVVFRGAPYVPSSKKYIKQALTELYPLNSSDLLVDIGSGDGIVLRQASKLGAQAIGYEINPILVLAASFLSRKDKKVTVKLTDFWYTSLPDKTTVVYVFSVTRDMKKIAERMQTEADNLDKTINLIVFGGQIKGLKPIKSLGAYCLYEFHSLQPAKPQV